MPMLIRQCMFIANMDDRCVHRHFMQVVHVCVVTAVALQPGDCNHSTPFPMYQIDETKRCPLQSHFIFLCLTHGGSVITA